MHPDQEDEIAYTLDRVRIPYFIWGEPLLRIYGILVPRPKQFSGWVVPDRFLNEANESMRSLGYEHCPHGKTCTFLQDGIGSHPDPDRHYHPGEYKGLCIPGIRELTISFYAKSRLFSYFPDPNAGPPEANDPYYTLASDARFPIVAFPLPPWVARGRHPLSRYPVKVPKPNKYIEAIIGLRCRALDGSMFAGHWIVEINFLQRLFTNDPENTRIRITDLSTPFRQYMVIRCFYNMPTFNRELISFQYLHRVYGELARADLLPPPEGIVQLGEQSDFQRRLREWNMMI
ncbi:hypothetical protein BO71DRAFT_376521 [Aspergillus ellipticus CBS 707.79]|uniref:Uncharacterized protein n=1 Tax=Aspergillus ellipticus CBS 707.79 TaxID=1448320 RepID=A0A319DER6_9EURO|nr:hypothetical protein BO71DRAFT_376521 [Aspergillus ellipticus CBS 707.79]